MQQGPEFVETIYTNFGWLFMYIAKSLSKNMLTDFRD